MGHTSWAAEKSEWNHRQTREETWGSSFGEREQAESVPDHAKWQRKMLANSAFLEAPLPVRIQLWGEDEQKKSAVVTASERNTQQGHRSSSSLPSHLPWWQRIYERDSSSDPIMIPRFNCPESTHMISSAYNTIKWLKGVQHLVHTNHKNFQEVGQNLEFVRYRTLAQTISTSTGKTAVTFAHRGPSELWETQSEKEKEVTEKQWEQTCPRRERERKRGGGVSIMSRGLASHGKGAELANGWGADMHLFWHSLSTLTQKTHDNTWLSAFLKIDKPSSLWLHLIPMILKTTLRGGSFPL